MDGYRTFPPELSHLVRDYGWLLNWVLTIPSYAGKKYGEWKSGRREQFDNRILGYVNTVPSTGIEGMWADVILKPILEDVSFDVAFRAPLTGFAKLKLNLKSLPYETRNRWRMMTEFVSEDEFKNMLTRLIRERRIDYEPTRERYRRRDHFVDLPFTRANR
jgi:hypothetical protein